jgi:hypothetical protein
MVNYMPAAHGALILESRSAFEIFPTSCRKSMLLCDQVQ